MRGGSGIGGEQETIYVTTECDSYYFVATQLSYHQGMDLRMKRHEVWRLQYREDPYLRDLSKSELLTRAGDLITVMLQHSTDGKIALMPISEDESRMARFTHVLEELVIRGVEYRQLGIVEAMKAPEPNSPKVRRALQIRAGRSWPDPILVKFGERKHMASFFLEGKGRVSLSKTYNDPSLGHARADDESQVSVYVHPLDAHRIMALEEMGPNGSRGMDVEVPYFGSVLVNLKANSDFYVYCMAESFDVRMFDDFTTPTCNVDTCVMISRPDEFKARIREAMAVRLPDWKLFDGSVTYVDPFAARVHQVIPQFSKHFRFGYQREHRLLWLPPNPEQPTDPAWQDHVYFDIGPLTDCADLVWL